MQNKKIYITLTEISRDPKSPDNLKEQPVVMNADFIVLAQRSELQKTSTLEVGATNFVEVTSLMLHNGRVVFSKETPEEVKAQVDRVQKEVFA